MSFSGGNVSEHQLSQARVVNRASPLNGHGIPPSVASLGPSPGHMVRTKVPPEKFVLSPYAQRRAITQIERWHYMQRGLIWYRHRPLIPGEGEVSIKEFMLTESQRYGVSVDTIGNWIYGRGSRCYRNLRLRRVTRRRVFVNPHATLSLKGGTLRPGEVSWKEFLISEAGRCGVKPATIAMRIYRGKYPSLKLRRLNQRRVFVKVQ